MMGRRAVDSLFGFALVVAGLLIPPVFATAQKPTPPAIAPAVPTTHPTRLERNIADRFRQIAPQLSPESAGKLDQASRALFARVVSTPGDVDALSAASREVDLRFQRLSSEQRDMLTFFVLAGAAKLATPPPARSNAVEKDQSDAAGEMSEILPLRLQLIQEARNKFLSAASSMMQAIAETHETIVKNMK